MSRDMEDGVEEILAAYREKINAMPALLSLLYDADLLPEQIVSMHGAKSMAAVVEAYEAGRRSELSTHMGAEGMEWQPITGSIRNDGDEIIVRLKNSHPRVPAEFLGRSVHQIGSWVQGDLWVRGLNVEDDMVEGVIPLPKPSAAR